MNGTVEISSFDFQGTALPNLGKLLKQKEDESTFPIYWHYLINTGIQELLNDLRIEQVKMLYRLFKRKYDQSEITSIKQEITDAQQEPAELAEKLNKTKKLNEQFDVEYEMNSSYFSDSKNIIKRYFEKVANYIVDLNYEKVSVEFTPDKSFFFNIYIRKECKVHIEYYLHQKKLNPENAFFNVFINKKSILNGYGRLENIISEINNFHE